MHMIRHEAKCMQAARRFTERTSQMKQIEAAIVLLVKARLSVVTAVNDVYRYAWQHEARASWHAAVNERGSGLVD
jgi:hypothetical protein